MVSDSKALFAGLYEYSYQQFVEFEYAVFVSSSTALRAIL